MLDTTAITGPLAGAATLLTRCLSNRASTSVASMSVLVTVDGDSIELAATDGELTARVRVAALGRQPGVAVVSRRGLAATLAALDAAETRLTVEGSRLAVRTTNARFALPQLDHALFAPLAQLPPEVGSVDGSLLRAAATPVAGAAAQQDALPIFTGVRLRSAGDRLAMVATDRFRMASAAPAWAPAPGGEVDVLVPAGFLAETARLAGSAATVTVYAAADRFGLSWPGMSVLGPALAQPFPDAQVARLFDAAPEATATLEASTLAAAVERATLYAGPHGRVSVQLGDGMLTVRGSDEQAGESEETVKADVHGGLRTATYRSRYLTDALRGFAGGPVTLSVQAGIRPTLFARPDGEDPLRLRCLVVPIRLPA